MLLHDFCTQFAHKVLTCLHQQLWPPEERDSVDPFGLGVGGHLGPQGGAHGLQQVRAVVQGAR